MFDANAAFQIDNTVFKPAEHSNVGSLITIIVRVLIITAGVLSFIFIIIGGIKIVTSGGDTKKLQSAQATILYAIIGVAVSLLSFMIVALIQRFIGSNIRII